VPKHDPQVPIAQRPRGHHVIQAFGHEDFAAHNTGIGDPTHQPDGDEHVEQARPQYGDDGQHQHNERKGEEDVDDAHQDRVDPASVEAGDQTDQRGVGGKLSEPIAAVGKLGGAGIQRIQVTGIAQIADETGREPGAIRGADLLRIGGAAGDGATLGLLGRHSLSVRRSSAEARLPNTKRPIRLAGGAHNSYGGGGTTHPGCNLLLVCLCKLHLQPSWQSGAQLGVVTAFRYRSMPPVRRLSEAPPF